MDKKVIVFGAGATGRGHIGLLAWQAGYQLVFVDKNPALVDLLKRAGHYRVQLYGGGTGAQACHEAEVSSFRVYHHEEREAIAAEFVDAALVLTAVFDQNLSDVAITVARGVVACRNAHRSVPLNVIACENMMDSSSTLGRYTQGLLSGSDLANCQSNFGFPDCMISRVVPRPEPNPLEILTEDYNEWTVRAEAFRGVPPEGLDTLELVTNQDARLERKLFIHNGGHAVCGYVGFHRGCRFIHEAVADRVVIEHVTGALDEIGEVVRRKHGFSAESINAYKQDLGRRGRVAELRDEVLRVVRDPIRKLSPRERLIAPASLAVEYGLPRRWIVRGIVAALKTCHQADSQSVRLSQKLAADGLPAVLAEVCGLKAGSSLSAEIQAAWDEWDVPR